MNRTSGSITKVKLLTSVVACLVVLTAVAAPASAKSEDDHAVLGHMLPTEEAESEIVIKIDAGVDLGELQLEHRMRVVRSLLPSRGLYTVAPMLLSQAKDDKKMKDLQKKLEKDRDVVWAELEESHGNLEDDSFHAWPDGLPIAVGGDPQTWLDQPNLDFLRLGEVHRQATGQGVTVAVLDTGADMKHRHLVDHFASGGHYDYIDDDANPMEETNGRDDDGDRRIDESYGHGTHTAGLVALVAPDADLLVYRVLDSDGSGNPYVVAEAIRDAIAAGADVINVSFGMDGKTKSKVLKDAFKSAEKSNVAIVAAVGNQGSKSERFPSREKSIIGVAAMANGNADLADFSNHGKASMVAAPGEDVVSTLPGGGFGAWSGTSMAAPIVAGQVALVRGNDPDRQIKKVIEIVGKSSDKIKVKSKRKVEKGLINILQSVEDS